MRSRRVATLAVALCLVLVGPSRAMASTGTGDSGGATTTTIVASEAPVPGAQKPEVGPFISTVHASGLGTYWWLVGFGGLQLVGLAVVTRRARHRTRLAEAPIAS